jgi:hypothetical protein
VRRGFSPLDQQLQLGSHGWTPETAQHALQLAAHIPYKRAAKTFEDLTAIPFSGSSLHRLMQEYGGQLVVQQAEEAEATIKPPAKFDEETFRQVPAPESEMVAVSMDGATIRIRHEGWKEVKTVTISEVQREQEENESEPSPSAEARVKLVKHSYRSGLWDAPTFSKQQWAEATRRGVEKAKHIVCVNDGALWIWAIVAMCYAPCIELLDWWHALQKLWLIANLLWGENNDLGRVWVERYQTFLWEGNLRPLFHYIRTRYRRGEPLPDGLRQAVGYFFTNRHRIHYQQYRQAGCPVGSGSVESACKNVVQGRLKQAGMSWSRPGAQAMLAVRAIILSDRWNEVWPTLVGDGKVA